MKISRNSMVLLGLTSLLVSAAAHATLVLDTISGPPGGGTYITFDTLPLGSSGGTSNGVSVAFTGGGGVVSGTSALYAAPFVSNGDGAPFGLANGVDTSPYLTTGLGTVTLTLPIQESVVGLLWGSVDTYNTLQLYNGATLVGTMTGTSVLASPTGNRGAGGSVYVDITSSLAFNKLVASSSSYAFELDNVALVAAPEPSTCALFVAGLGMIGFMVRRRGA